VDRQKLQNSWAAVKVPYSYTSEVFWLRADQTIGVFGVIGPMNRAVAMDRNGVIED
jgi:hypothetical protein